MKQKFLFPNSYKKYGWLLLVPTLIFGAIAIFSSYEPEFLEVNVFAIFNEGIFGKKENFSIIKNNILNEIIGVVLIISSLLVAFSVEKDEDEFISKIRLESLVWATYVSYGILLLTILFVYDISFFTVMLFNMFTILWFFIARFNYQIWKLKKSASYEE